MVLKAVFALVNIELSVVTGVAVVGFSYDSYYGSIDGCRPSHLTAVLKAVLALLAFRVTIITAIEVVGFSNDYYYGPIGTSLSPRSASSEPSNHSPTTKILASAQRDYRFARPPFVRGNKNILPSQRVTLATANGAEIVSSIALWPGC